MTRSRTSLLRSTLLLSALGALASVAYAADAPGQPQSAISGEKVYERWCAPCHAPGPGHPGTQSLQVKYGGKTPAVLLERTDLSPEAVSVFVRQGLLMMAPFRKTEITDAELAALSAFVARNYKGR
ncbi:MAG: cytochrome c [Steroidobacteraceae bacterium]|nr:cytochrome c [Steroidobacteraceae bacterium]